MRRWLKRGVPLFGLSLLTGCVGTLVGTVTGPFTGQGEMYRLVMEDVPTEGGVELLSAEIFIGIPARVVGLAFGPLGGFVRGIEHDAEWILRTEGRPPFRSVFHPFSRPYRDPPEPLDPATPGRRGWRRHRD